MKTLRQIIDILTSTERRAGLELLVMVCIMALLDALGVASIMPFISLLTNPSLVDTHPILRSIKASLGIGDALKLQMALGGIVFVALFASIAFKALTNWAQFRATQTLCHTLSARLLARYLRQPFEWFLLQNSSRLGKTITSEVDQVMNGSIIPMMNLITQGAVALTLLGLLVAAAPALALSMALGFGFVYGLLYTLLRRLLARLGQERMRANRIRFTTLSEVFGGIKEVKVGAREAEFQRRFDAASLRFAHTQVAAQAAAQLPRYLLEMIAFGGMLGVVLYLTHREGGIQSALPTIALYALACYRLLPALQQIYAAITKLRFATPALDQLHLDLTRPIPPIPPKPASHQPRLAFSNGLSLKHASYRYPGAEHAALQDISLNISTGARVGIVGRSGAGKSTLVDILLGLLPPQEGTLSIDDVSLTPETVLSWQGAVGYVPQQAYLADDTLTANIAFGVPPEQIDQAVVERCARLCALHDFVMNELPEGYNTPLGERGVRLSGGQRQRISIARALYHAPSLLILDEATSGLDVATEHTLLRSIRHHAPQLTLVLISHRLATLRECDCLYLVKDGRLVGEANFDTLAATHPEFQRLLQESTE